MCISVAPSVVVYTRTVHMRKQSAYLPLCTSDVHHVAPVSVTVYSQSTTGVDGISAPDTPAADVGDMADVRDIGQSLEELRADRFRIMEERLAEDDDKWAGFRYWLFVVAVCTVVIAFFFWTWEFWTWVSCQMPSNYAACYVYPTAMAQ